MSPTVSIIVPVFKVEKWLPRCIDSIQQQSCDDFELIMTDDGSDDSSGSICDERAMSDLRIIVIHKRNSGVSSARNAGIDLSKGENLTFVDSDDYLESSYLETFLVTKADLTLGGIITETEVGKIISKTEHNSQYKAGNEIVWYNIFRSGDIHAPYGKLMQRSIVQENNIRFPTDISWGEDAVFNAEYLSHTNSVCEVGNYTYHYVLYKNEKRLTSTIRENVIDDITKSREYVFKKYEEISFSDSIKVKDQIEYEIMKSCGYFVKFLFENKSLSFSEKKIMLSRFMNNQYVMKGASQKIHPYSEIVSRCVLTRKPTIALLIYRFYEMRRENK